MQTVKVEKKQLQATLKENRSKHLKEYREALVNHAEKVKTLATKLGEQAGKSNPNPEKLKKQAQELWSLPQPRSFAEDYTRAIEMLEWELEEDVKLTQTEFKQFVQDEWSWQHEFATSTSFYNSN